jgi:alkanesulfonate monooxygenase
VRLGVCFGSHFLPWEEQLALVRRAEALGYAAAYVDGDCSMLAERPELEVLDGWTVTTALLAQTERIPIGSLRLVHHWNAARLAQAVATAERMAPGRLRFLISGGDRDIDARFGLPRPGPAERVGALDEMMTALRALWRGESVTMRGRHVQLDGARLCPVPPGGRIPVEIAAKRPRMIALVAAHADVW